MRSRSSTRNAAAMASESSAASASVARLERALLQLVQVIETHYSELSTVQEIVIGHFVQSVRRDVRREIGRNPGQPNGDMARQLIFTFASSVNMALSLIDEGPRRPATLTQRHQARADVYRDYHRVLEADPTLAEFHSRRHALTIAERFALRAANMLRLVSVSLYERELVASLRTDPDPHRPSRDARPSRRSRRGRAQLEADRTAAAQADEADR